MSERLDGGAAPVVAETSTIFDFGSVVLAFTPTGKMILVPKDDTRHLTVNLGGRSGILDGHLTDRGAGTVHESLGGLRVGDLEELLQRAQPTIDRNLERLVRRTLRRVRFGWLGHYGIYAFPFVMNEDALLGFGTRRGRRWTIDQVRFAEQFMRPLTRAEVDASTSAAFLLSKRGDTSEIYGALFKIPLSGGNCGYFWFKSDQLWNEILSLWRCYEPLVRPHLLTGGEVMAAVKASHQPHG
jgi:hypothetical protein